MTLNELRNDVAQLGFESYIEDEDTFLSSANRALKLIYTDRPISKTIAIPIGAPRITLHERFIEHHRNEQLTFYLTDGMGIYFSSTGTGICSIANGNGTETINLVGTDTITKRVLTGEESITFSGDNYFTISNMTVYDELPGNSEFDIPSYTPWYEINPESYCSDFRAFASQPTNENGEVLDRIILRDGRLYIPRDFTGLIYLTYYRLPEVITAENDNAAIDISGECSALLPLLCAAFMWLDDDSAKAQYYMSLYRDAIANIKRFSVNQIDTVCHTNGWA